MRSWIEAFVKYDEIMMTLTGIIKEVEEGDYSLATDSEVRAESRSISLLRAMVLVERWQKLAGLIK